MIKCNVTACGIIVSSAVEKQNKEGGKIPRLHFSCPY